jgi:uncharacterized protein YeaO (DUF488 family)
MAVILKRVYAEPSPQDGARVLVDRLWPRGLKKSDATLDAWLKDLAPSHELRKWFHAHPQQWKRFREQYLKELSNQTAHEALQRLYDLKGERRRLTLLYASRNEERNHAVVLKELVEGDRKPPTGTGPIRTAAAKRARTAQRR